LLRTVCDGFLLVADGRAQEFDGDVDDYLAWLTERRARSEAAVPSASTVSDREARRVQRENANAERQARLARRRPLAKEAARLEREIAELEAEKSVLEARLGDTTFYTADNVAEVQVATRRAAETARLLTAAEERWLEVQSELEAIGDA
jgi:ATP-binding cassette subfamily F protein 3